jgi:predicted membrane protein
MQRKLSPALKGLITGAMMLLCTLLIYYFKQPADSPLQSIIYILYALGITWTLYAYRNSETFIGKFGDLFAQGFRCFIVVTLIMVSFTALFTYMHPEFAEETSKAYKEELVKKKEKMPADIDKEVALFKKQFTVQLVSASIFGYLIIGAAATTAVSAFLIKRK